MKTPQQLKEWRQLMSKRTAEINRLESIKRVDEQWTRTRAQYIADEQIRAKERVLTNTSRSIAQQEWFEGRMARRLNPIRWW